MCSLLSQIKSPIFLDYDAESWNIGLFLKYNASVLVSICILLETKRITLTGRL